MNIAPAWIPWLHDSHSRSNGPTNGHICHQAPWRESHELTAQEVPVLLTNLHWKGWMSLPCDLKRMLRRCADFIVVYSIYELFYLIYSIVMFTLTPVLVRWTITLRRVPLSIKLGRYRVDKTRHERSLIIKSGWAASNCSRVCVVNRAITLQPAARPLRMPEGASSKTMPGG